MGASNRVLEGERNSTPLDKTTPTSLPMEGNALRPWSGSALVPGSPSGYSLPPAMPTGNVHFISLGCPKNLVDSEVLLGRLVLDDFAVCEKAEDADIIVVNTCGFLEASRQESIGVIREACEWKEKGSASGVVVAGCLAQRGHLIYSTRVQV